MQYKICIKKTKINSLQTNLTQLQQKSLRITFEIFFASQRKTSNNGGAKIMHV